MRANSRKDLRQKCHTCRCEILQVNGEQPDQSQQYEGTVENISKGGFRFVTSKRFELDDRVKARIIFNDGKTHETLGRICYCNEDENAGCFAYGFSVLNGFIH